MAAPEDLDFDGGLELFLQQGKGIDPPTAEALGERKRREVERGSRLAPRHEAGTALKAREIAADGGPSPRAIASDLPRFEARKQAADLPAERIAASPAIHRAYTADGGAGAAAISPYIEELLSLDDAIRGVTPREVSTFESLGHRWERGGIIASELPDVAAPLIAAFLAGREVTPGQMAAFEAVRKRLKEQVDAPGVVDDLLGPATEQIQIQMRTLGAAGVGAVAGGATGAGAGALAGAVVPVPGLGSLAGALMGAPIGAAWGAKALSGLQAARMEGSAAFEEYFGMIGKDGQPVSGEVAALGGVLVGLINGSLELGGTVAMARIVGLAKYVGLGRKAIIAKVSEELIKPGKVAALRKVTAALLKATGAEIVTELAQEGVTMGGGLVARGETLEDISAEDFQSGVSRLGHTALQTALAVGPLVGGARATVATAEAGARAVDKAYQNRLKTAAIAAAVQDGQLRNVSPRVFSTLSAEIAQEAGMEQVFVPVESLQTLYQDDLQALYEDLPSAQDELAESFAGDLGGDVAISVEDFFALVGSKDPGYVESLLDSVKLVPEDLTPGEAEILEANLIDSVEEMVADEASRQESDLDSEQSASLVYDVVEKMLRATGRYSDDAVRQHALLWRQRYRTRSERLGGSKTPLELFHEQNIRLVGPEGQEAPLQPTAREIALTADLGRQVADLRSGRQRELEGLQTREKRYPILSLLKKRGGVEPDSPFGRELLHLGVTKQMVPELFVPGGAEQSDVLGEFAEEEIISGNIETTTDSMGATVVDPNALLDAIHKETRDQPLRLGEEQEAIQMAGEARSFLSEEIDALGIDLDSEISDSEIAARVLEGRFLGQPAWHGSPHKFDKFTLDHIGTGEGAQAYGWGLYFAGKRRVGEFYRETLTPGHTTSLVLDGVDLLPGNFRVLQGITSSEKLAELDVDVLELDFLRSVFATGSVDEALSRLKASRDANREELQAYDDAAVPADDPARYSVARALGDAERRIEAAGAVAPRISQVEKKTGQLYEVDIPEDDDLLDYDKPLSEQPPRIIQALRTLNVREQIPEREIPSDELRTVIERDENEQARTGEEYPFKWFEIDEDGDENWYDLTEIAEQFSAMESTHPEFYKRIRSEFTRPAVEWFDYEGDLVEPSRTGEHLYKDLVRAHLSDVFEYSRGQLTDASKAASESLLAAGIPGLRYFDGSSRKSGEGTHNYVIWDEEAISVLSTLYQPAPGRPRVAAVFSGMGTLEAAIGAENVVAVESEPHVVEAYNAAHGAEIEPRSVFDLTPEEVRDLGAPLFHASPVCKNCSKAKSRRTIDEDDLRSGEKVAEIIREAHPPAVSLENVPGYRGTIPHQMITTALEEAGYTWDEHLVDAADYGGAQTRKRLIIRAVLEGELPALPEKTGPTDWWALVEDLVDEAPESTIPAWEMTRIGLMVERGSLDWGSPIITMGGSASNTTAAAANAGGAAPTLKSTRKEVPRILLPDGRVVEVTPRMMARLMGLDDSVVVPDKRADAKEVLGNGIHGEISRQFIAPLIDDTLHQPATGRREILTNADGSVRRFYHGGAGFHDAPRGSMWLTPDRDIALHYSGEMARADEFTISMEEPVHLEGAADVERLLRHVGWTDEQLDETTVGRGEMQRSAWGYLEDADVVAALQSLGYDGAVVYDDQITAEDSDAPVQHTSYFVFDAAERVVPASQLVDDTLYQPQVDTPRGRKYSRHYEKLGRSQKSELARASKSGEWPTWADQNIRDGFLVATEETDKPGAFMRVLQERGHDVIRSDAETTNSSYLYVRDVGLTIRFSDHSSIGGSGFDPNTRETWHVRAMPVTEATAKFASMLESMADTLDQPQRAGPPAGKRGGITGLHDPEISSVLIRFAASSDLSTLIHEGGHLWLAELSKDARQPGAPQQLVDDLAKILAWLGISSVEEIKTVHHERVAAAVEEWVREGKAPSVALESVFSRMMLWLRDIYRDVRQLLGRTEPLSDEVREVFARLVATDEEIAEASAQGGLTPLFDAAGEAGISEAAYGRIVKAYDDARDEGTADLNRRLMATLRREQRADWEQKKQRMRAKVEPEVRARPEIRARDWLQENESHHMRMSLIDSAYGRSVRIRLGQKYKARRRIYSKKGTLAPGTVAARFGLPTDQLIQLLLDLNSTETIIREEVDRRLLEEFGDPMTDGTLAEVAAEAAYNDRAMRGVLLEEQALARKTGRGATARQEIQREAERVIANKDIHELHPFRYRQAAARASRASIEAFAARDLAEAQRQKRRQAVNMALEMESRRAKEQVQKHLDGFKRIQGKAIWSMLGRAGTAVGEETSYQDTVATLLEKYDLRKSVTLDEALRRKSLEQWVREQEARDEEALIPGYMMREVGKGKHWKTIPVRELTDLHHAITSVVHLARQQLETKVEGEKVALEHVVATAIGEIETNMPARKGKRYVNQPALEQTKGALRSGWRMLDKVEHLLDALGGGDPNSMLRRAIWDPLREAMAKYNRMMGDVVEQLTAMEAKLDKKDRRALLGDVGLEFPDGTQMDSLNQWNLIHIALNLGNESNRQRLLSGYGWDDDAGVGLARLQKVLNERLSREEWAYVEEVWQYIETFWPAVVAQELELVGVAPPKVEAIEVQTPYGTIKGGYYPVVYDKGYSSLGEKIAGEKLLAGNSDGFARPQTGHGHTRGRAAEVHGQPLLLERSVLGSHLDQVVLDLTHRAAILQVSKILSREDINAAIQSRLGPEYTYAKMWKPWLQDIARDTADPGPLGPAARVAREVRVRGTAFKLGLRATTLAAQVSGHFNAYRMLQKRLGATQAARYWVRGLRQSLLSPRQRTKMRAWMENLSPFMRDRVGSYNRDARDAIRDASRTHAWTKEMSAAGLEMIGWVQMVTVDEPVWIASYNAAIEGAVKVSGPMSQSEAVRFADSMVSMSQGSGTKMDQSAWERGAAGGEFLKLSTMFFSYNATQGAQGLRELRGVKGKGWVEQAGTALSAWWFYFLAPGLFAWAMKIVMPDLLGGREPPEDEAELAATLAKLAVKETVGPVPILRDVHAAVFFGERHRPYGGIAILVDELADLSNIDGPGDLAFDALALGGAIFGLPVDAPLSYAEEALEEL